MAQPNVYIARLAQRLEEGGSETVIALDRLTTVTGEEINTSDFALFGRGIITINPDGDGSSSFPEFISFTGVNQADKALTGCVRGLSAKGNNVVEANKRFYPSGTRVAITFGYHDIQDIVNYINDELGAVTVGTNANVTGIAGESLVAGNLIYLKDDGKWWKTVGTDQTTLFGVQIGIAQGGAVADASIPGGVMRKGADDSLSGLTIGDTLYAGDTPGSIVNEAGTVERVVGVVRASDAWYFDPDYRETQDKLNDTRYAIDESTRDTVNPENDEHKLVKLESDGRLSRNFIPGAALAEFTLEESGVWVPPSFGDYFLVFAWGSGGGGGARIIDNDSWGVTGGSGGAVGYVLIPRYLLLDEEVNYVIGDGGAGASATSGEAINGLPGSETSFGSFIVAAGGEGGIAGIDNNLATGGNNNIQSDLDFTLLLLRSGGRSARRRGGSGQVAEDAPDTPYEGAGGGIAQRNVFTFTTAGTKGGECLLLGTKGGDGDASISGNTVGGTGETACGGGPAASRTGTTADAGSGGKGLVKIFVF